jgi:hypothetical protein
MEKIRTSGATFVDGEGRPLRLRGPGVRRTRRCSRRAA